MRLGLIVVGFVFTTICSIAVATKTNHLVYNHTDSIPRGYYRTVPFTHIKRDMIVVVCPPKHIRILATVRHYLKPGVCDGLEPMIKYVAAIPGDTVEVSAREVDVNGTSLPISFRSKVDSQGKPLAHVPDGTYVIPPGEIWLAGRTRKSCDSRYYGPVSADLVLSQAFPIVTF